MRSLLTIAILLFCLPFAKADSGTSLKENMKFAEKIFKSIAASSRDASKNQENIQKVDEMTEYFRLTVQQIPDIINELPEGEQKTAFEDYQKMMEEVLALANQLREAFASNNNPLAFELCQKMKDLKQDGHDKYNP